MEERRTLIIAGVIAVLALILLGALIFYLIKAFTGSSSNVVTSSPTPTQAASSGPTISGQGNQNPAPSGSNKTFNGSNFSLQYPSSWGVLSCTNSTNFEFNPNGGDQRVSCDVAQDPITVLVGSSSGCSGAGKTLGNNKVLYSKQSDPSGYITYQWCTQGGPTVLNISERVSPNGERATSVRDYSAEVEQMITTIRFGGGS